MRHSLLVLPLLLATAASLATAADSPDSLQSKEDSVELDVPANDPKGASLTLLTGTYRLRAIGTYTFNAAGDTADAEYIFTSAGSCIDLDDPAFYDEEGDPRYDLRDNVPGFSIRQWGTGCDDANHTYGPTRWPNVGVEDFTCAEVVCTATFWIDDPDSYADNVGSLRVRFTKLS